jgi:hypothetical protein
LEVRSAGDIASRPGDDGDLKRATSNIAVMKTNLHLQYTVRSFSSYKW